jgi:hypothetical protein
MGRLAVNLSCWEKKKKAGGGITVMPHIVTARGGFAIQVLDDSRVFLAHIRINCFDEVAK